MMSSSIRQVHEINFQIFINRTAVEETKKQYRNNCLTYILRAYNIRTYTLYGKYKGVPERHFSRVSNLIKIVFVYKSGRYTS